MRRGLLILLCLLAVTWFEFQVYPGHRYLQGETQLLVPMLQRLDAPGFLSRDLVATNPALAYTILDEFTQLLHLEARLSIEQALLFQQLLFRFAAILGIFLLARALKVAPFAAVVLSGAVNAITHLAAPDAYLTNPEPVPVAFALSLVLLAGGFMVRRKPLFASITAGVALLYDPLTAAPFWIALIAAFIFDRNLRRLLRPIWPAMLVYALVLGNLVQLQTGLASDRDLTTKMSAAMVQLTKVRTPSIWVSTWLATGIWSYVFLLVAGVWALTRIWNKTDRLTNWVVIGLSAGGISSVPVAMFLLAQRLPIATAMPPARNLAFTVACSALICGAAAFHAAQERMWRESLPWVALSLAAILNPQVLDLLHLQFSGVTRPASSSTDVRALAAWAETSTWGSSMFQFADAGKQNDPGVFRVLSRRSLWADWQSGLIADYSDQAGQQWWSRWQSGMAEPYSAHRLEAMLPQPIDYYVLRREHELAGIKPAYSNSRYVVYDAQDLREAHAPLKPARRPD